MDTPMLSADQVTDLVKGAVADAIKAVNTVTDDARPAAVKAEAPAIITRTQAFPSLKRAMKNALHSKQDGYEAEFTAAAYKAFGYNDLGDNDSVTPGAVIWPKSLEEARTVFETMGASKHRDRVDSAIKAMSNDGSYALTGGTAGGILVPPEFAQSLFAYALAPRNALRRVPGVRVIPVTSNNIRLPRESVRAGASQANEAGTLTPTDATLAQQSIDIEKQYAMRRWSDELGADSDPAFMAFLDATVVRDLAIQQDSQWLTGNGTPPQVYGLINYSGLTTGPSLGTNGRTPSHDDILDAVYLLDAVNADADFAIGHPRAINSLRKVKDAQGRYLITPSGSPQAVGAGFNGSGADAVLADVLPFYKTTNLSITQTVGSSTDCTTIIVGDSRQVVILERQGVEVMFSPHIYFTTGEMAVRATARSAVAILQPTAVTLITGVRP